MKAVLLGTGWRARFFMRISHILPSVLDIVSIYTRAEERAEELRKEGYPAFSDLDAALSSAHEAVIVASGKAGFLDTLCYLHDRGERIIAETTFLSLEEEELAAVEGYGGLVMEQYSFTPLFASTLSSLPLLGGVDQLYLSGLHNHHAAAIARKVLSLGSSLPEEIYTMDFPSRMMKTGSRQGLEVFGEMEAYTRKVRMMRFGSSLFINDFSSNQYHSYLYGKSFGIRGEKGVLSERGLSAVDYPLEMNDDEIAMARMLELYDMGEDVYPFREGVADARLGRLL